MEYPRENTEETSSMDGPRVKLGRGLMAKVLTFGEEQQQKIPSISDTRQKRNDTCLDYSSTQHRRGEFKPRIEIAAGTEQKRRGLLLQLWPDITYSSVKTFLVA